MLKGKVVVITGAGRGLGQAMAVNLAKSGCELALIDRDKPLLATTAARCQDLGVNPSIWGCDVSNEDAVQNVFGLIAEQYGRLDGVVNNAGIIDRSVRIQDMDQQRLERMFQINIVGSFLCAGAAVRRMATSEGGEGGAIVNLSSVASRIGSPGEFIDYAASKGAIDTLTIGLAKELAAEGIRVNAVRPGLIDTDIHADTGDAERPVRLAPSVPMQRTGTPEEVASCILWLLSDQAGYVTGSILDVAGGR